MWRKQSIHERGNSEFLTDAIKRLEKDAELRMRADSFLTAAAQAEPLIAESLLTPQSPKYHAEGPRLEDHLRSILTVLYALDEEKLHCVDIEELRGMKGYEGEIDELEETIKENIEFYEIFAVCHDTAKWSTFYTDCPVGSRGEKMGFNLPASARWNIATRAKTRRAYLDLYRQFTEMHAGESPREQQWLFYLAYQIDVHYPGHGQAIHTPVYRQLLRRFAGVHQLKDRAADILENIIGHHLEPMADFQTVAPKKMEKYFALARQYQYDADDFIDLLQGAVFLDMVCSAKRRTGAGFFHELYPLTHFLQSEFNFAPARRQLKIEQQVAEEKKQRNKIYKDIGLDGLGISKLFSLKPGPELGRHLKNLHDAIEGRGTLPSYTPTIDKELAKRVQLFYEKAFEKAGPDE